MYEHLSVFFRCLLVVFITEVVSVNAAVAACLVDATKLREALRSSVKASGGPANGGFENHQWAALVGRDGLVCGIAFSGDQVGDQWPGSRAIAMEKAATANAFSLKAMALSTANLFALAQPGQSLYGIVTASPPSPEVNNGDAALFGTANDPMIGKRAGGVIVFGGGLALYNGTEIAGALGVSGDSACADHNVAWRVRKALGLDKVPAGVSPQRKDAIIYDLNAAGQSASGFGHPKCAGSEAQIADQIEAGVGGVPLK